MGVKIPSVVSLVFLGIMLRSCAHNITTCPEKSLLLISNLICIENSTTVGSLTLGNFKIHNKESKFY